MRLHHMILQKQYTGQCVVIPVKYLKKQAWKNWVKKILLAAVLIFATLVKATLVKATTGWPNFFRPSLPASPSATPLSWHAPQMMNHCELGLET